MAGDVHQDQTATAVVNTGCCCAGCCWRDSFMLLMREIAGLSNVGGSIQVAAD